MSPHIQEIKDTQSMEIEKKKAGIRQKKIYSKSVLLLNTITLQLITLYLLCEYT
jgi:hypothetical protein